MGTAQAGKPLEQVVLVLVLVLCPSVAAGKLLISLGVPGLMR